LLERGFRGLSFFRALGAVFGTTLTTLGDALRIKDAAHNVIANAREVSDSSAAHQDGGVFLQVVSFTWNIDGHFFPVGQAHAGNPAKG